VPAASHILIPIHDFSAGGTELIAFRLAREWLKAGRRVSVLAGASDGPLRPRVPEGAEVHILSPERPRSRFSRLFLGGQMAPVARALAPDAVFIPGNFHFMLGKGLRAALPHAGIIAKDSNPLWSDDWVPGPLARASLAAATKGIDRIVAMAPALQPEVSRYVAPDRIAVIEDPFLDDGAAFAVRANIPMAGRLNLLTVARLEPQKDPVLAVQSMKALTLLGVEAHLTILGSGPMHDMLARLIEQLGLGSSVTLAGYVADPSPYYRAADMLLMSSRFEGVPAVIGEALVHGLPFVATDCSPWLTSIAREHPALGTVTTARDPEALAQAIIDRQHQVPATTQDIELAIGRHRAGPAAIAYLALFDALQRS
jgi:glycosyltransferase involved in cell wall biosynthesis